MLSDNEAAVIVTTVLTTAVTTTTLALAWMRRRPLHPATKPEDPRLEEKIDQVQQSLEAIALEVERISEAQRFTAKLLSERAGPLPRQSGKSITPH